MRRKILAAVLLSGFWFSTQISLSQAQDWPDPLVELVSISTDTSTFYTDNKLRFHLVIDRINSFTYSDITRVWICPVNSWDGFLCNAGQFLVSITPNSSDSSFTIESPALNLADGNYLITGVSFRNGAVLSGFTLMYPRSGVVTIGGIATNIPLVNLAQADFNLAQPEPVIAPDPEPIIEPERMPESEKEPIAENESQTETEQDVNSDASLEGSSDSTDSSHEETPVESEETTETDETTESTENVELTGPINSTNVESENSDTPTAETSDESIDEPSSELTSKEPAVSADEPDAEVDSANSEATPSTNIEIESAQPIIQTQPNVSPEKVSPQPAVLVPEVKPEIIQPEVVTSELLPEPTPELFSEGVLPTMQQLDRRSATGGKLMQVIGRAKLVKKVPAGSGSLQILATNDSTVTILINQRVISELVLTKNQTITWFSRKPGKLKLLLKGDNPELLIDSLKVNGKLFANPTFQMRN